VKHSIGFDKCQFKQILADILVYKKNRDIDKQFYQKSLKERREFIFILSQVSIKRKKSSGRRLIPWKFRKRKKISIDFLCLQSILKTIVLTELQIKIWKYCWLIINENEDHLVFFCSFQYFPFNKELFICRYQNSSNNIFKKSILLNMINSSWLH